MIFEASIASGRGTCCICHKEIKKGTLQIVAWGWKTSGRAHWSCIQREVKDVLTNTLNTFRTNKEEKGDENNEQEKT